MKSGNHGIIIAVAFAAIIASVVVASSYMQSQNIGATSFQSTSFEPYPSCDTRPWVMSLAYQVEQNPKFVSAASVSTHWLLVYAGNETETIRNDTYFGNLTDVALNFYSFPNASAVSCNKDAVVYVLFAKVPISKDGDYNFGGLTAYSERFYPNATSST